LLSPVKNPERLLLTGLWDEALKCAKEAMHRSPDFGDAKELVDDLEEAARVRRSPSIPLAKFRTTRFGTDYKPVE
jgi:hypothetical protein